MRAGTPCLCRGITGTLWFLYQKGPDAYAYGVTSVYPPCMLQIVSKYPPLRKHHAVYSRLTLSEYLQLCALPAYPSTAPQLTAYTYA